MGFRLGPDSAGNFVIVNNNLVRLDNALVTVRGQQYAVNGITAVVTPVANTTYYVFVDTDLSGAPVLVVTTDRNYGSSILVSSFFSNNLNQLVTVFQYDLQDIQKLVMPVGTIVQSMLTEAQFQQLNGTEWILADGRNIAGSRYSQVTGINTVPDVRGQFLRGKNNGRTDGNQDPAGERPLGNWQNEEMKAHDHTLRYGGGNGVTGVYGENGTTGTLNEIAMGNTGGLETRPKNIACNVFIKIN